jgi:hypothetical protein
MTERSLVRNAADEEQVKDAARVERQREKDEGSRWLAVLSTKEGRAVVWQILGYCRMFETFCGDSATLQFHEGSRNVGRVLWTKIEGIDPGIILTMMREAHQEKIAHAI